ncbi:hypothetical protein ARSQ2_01178 [Arsenophonus endosymbiont of Bemisia tabaci Q2]|nr:hypothetical protein ARSQ2_01178 [Arsenophonus endosymbiont of Bemisia tabaci Q2]
MLVLIIIAAIIGDAVNYTIGRLFGERLFSNLNSKIFDGFIWKKQTNFMKTWW